MKFIVILLLFLFLGEIEFFAQEISPKPILYSIEPVLSFGKIVKNAPEAPTSGMAMLSEINLAIQTDGRREWHQFYNFPKIGVVIPFGGLGNRRELGSFIGIAPNLTLNAMNTKWYIPRISLGLGIAYFTNPYNIDKNTTNYYIGSAFTAMGYASFYVQPALNDRLSFKTGISVIHCSNGHVQIPNLGINLPAIYIGLTYHPRNIPLKFERYNTEIPKGKYHLNLSFGMGVHQLARTTEPIGTAKYAVYIAEIYVSRRFGKISNVLAGVEFKQYNSYYRYIVENNFFTENQKLKSSVITLFLGHEFMMGHVSFLTQGGINVYNPFYLEHIKMYKSEGGLKSELKKYISTRMGLQYYIWDPKHCTRSNIFIGAYIKANFGQADFICTQVGFVF